MPAVRLPQSIKEIDSAAQIIVDTAYPERLVSPSRQMALAYDTDRKHIARWLGSIAAMGAIMHVDLVTQAELCLDTSSEYLQSLRPGRIATLIARRTWLA